MSTNNRRIGRLSRLIALLLALALIAAACGSDDDTANGADGADSTDSSGDSGDDSDSTTSDDGAGADGTASGLLGDDFPEVDARGVTDDSIKVGAAFLFVSDLGETDESFANFHARIIDHYDSALQRMRDAGRLPVHGRDIELTTVSYQATPEGQRAACLGLVEDEQVALVVAAFLFPVGFECVAAENETPVLLSDSTTEAILERSFPYGFAIGAGQERVLRNLPHIVDASGLLGTPDEPRQVGIYSSDAPVDTALLDETFVAELTALGYPEPVLATYTELDDIAAAELAVQRFISEGVEVAFVSNDRGNFLTVANSQGASWDYLDSDVNFGTTDSATQAYPVDWERVQSITVRHGGEPASGLERTPAQQECADGYVDYTAGLAASDDYYPEGGWVMEDNTFHLQSLYHACDLIETTVQMLEAIGPNVQPDSIVAGYESLEGPIEWARTLPGGFSADQHHGADFYRVLSWAAECPAPTGNLTACYYLEDENLDPQPFFVP